MDGRQYRPFTEILFVPIIAQMKLRRENAAMGQKGRIGLAVTVLVGLITPMASAQTPTRLIGEFSSALSWGIALFVIAIMSATAFISSKRSHKN